MGLPVSCELAMLVCVCYSFNSAKNEVAYFYWLQFYCFVIETHDAEFVKYFSEESVSSNIEDKVQGFSKCSVV